MQTFTETQATTIASGTAETAITPANPQCGNALCGLVVTTINAVAATLTLRESLAGATRGIFDYPNAAVAPGSPLNISFEPPLMQPINSTWTIQASVAAGAIHITALYVPEN